MAKQTTATRVLAVGAAGKFAGLVVPELAKRGALVRGMVRDAGQADGVRQRGASEIAVADLRDAESLRAALQDVDAVFYLAPVFQPDEADLGRGLVEAAAEAGVRRFVFSSVTHPSLAVLQNHGAKAPVEEAILLSGMEYVILQPTMFFQNLTAAWPAVVEHGVLAEPWSCDTRFNRVDFRDVAEAAALALTEDRLLYGTYELCAEGRIDRREMARLAGEVLGRELEAAVADKPEVGTPLRRLFDHCDRHGLSGNPLVLRAVLGREPRTLRAFFEELAAASDGRQ